MIHFKPISKAIKQDDVIMVSRGKVVFKIAGDGTRLIFELKKITEVVQPDFKGKNSLQIEKEITALKDSPFPLIVDSRDFGNMFFLLCAVRQRTSPILVLNKSH